VTNYFGRGGYDLSKNSLIVYFLILFKIQKRRATFGSMLKINQISDVNLVLKKKITVPFQGKARQGKAMLVHGINSLCEY
jgi:hypothetical protein